MIAPTLTPTLTFPLERLTLGVARLENPFILINKRLLLSVTGEEFALEGGNPKP